MCGGWRVGDGGWGGASGGGPAVILVCLPPQCTRRLHPERSKGGRGSLSSQPCCQWRRRCSRQRQHGRAARRRCRAVLRGAAGSSRGHAMLLPSAGRCPAGGQRPTTHICPGLAACVHACCCPASAVHLGTPQALAWMCMPMGPQPASSILVLTVPAGRAGRGGGGGWAGGGGEGGRAASLLRGRAGWGAGFARRRAAGETGCSRHRRSPPHQPASRPTSIPGSRARSSNTPVHSPVSTEQASVPRRATDPGLGSCTSLESPRF